MRNQLQYTSCIAALSIALLTTSAFAGAGEKGHGHGQEAESEHSAGGHGDHGTGHSDHGHAMNPTVGQKGEPSDARRAMRITMRDNNYSPKSITVKKGETVRFIVENKGEFVHEFNIGTAEMHQGHQGEMLAMMQSGALEADKIVHAKMGDMKHDDPNSVLLEPGQKGEVVWKFGGAGEIQFACNVPGHYEAGMHGKLKIR